MPDATTPSFGFTEPTVGADNGTWGGVLNTDLVNLDTYLAVLRQAAKAATVGATTTLDFNSPGSVFTFTVTQATTIAFANVPANITTQQLSTQVTIIITNGGAFAVTWPASVIWSGGSAPNLQVSGTDVVILWSPNNGTNWYGGVLVTAGKLGLLKVGQNSNGVITGGVTDTSFGNVQTLLGGKLATNGDFVRITITGRFKDLTGGSDTATFRVKFGATVLSFALAAGTGGSSSQGLAFSLLVTIVRVTGTSQQITGTMTTALGVVVQSTTAAETLANNVSIDLRGQLISSTDALYLDAAPMEAATQ